MSVAEYQRKSAKDARKQQKLMRKNARLRQKAQNVQPKYSKGS